jgi:hypothetical protein
MSSLTSPNHQNLSCNINIIWNKHVFWPELRVIGESSECGETTQVWKFAEIDLRNLP